MKNIELHWICEAPSHYNDHLFGALSGSAAARLNVYFMLDSIGSHPWKTKVQRAYRNRVFKKRLGVDWFVVRQACTTGKGAVFFIGGWFDFTAMAVILICALRGRPFVIWTDTPNERGSGRLGAFAMRFRALWIGFIFRNASFVLGTGAKALAVLKKMGCSTDKLINLPYFTDHRLFSPASAGDEAQDVVFLSSGRLDNSVKGYDTAIRALSLLRKARPDLRFKYRIAGLGRDLDSLKGMVDEEKLSGCVEFAGWLEAADLPQFYRSGTIFLHPARYEPYGVAVIEAMASGLAVIGSGETGAVADRITHGQNGYIHRSGDAEGLFNTILEALSNRARLEEVRKNARRTAEQWPVERGVETIIKTATSCVES